MADLEEFKFPDEAEEKPQADAAEETAAQPELQIEIEDDTPEEDRGMKPYSKRMREELENDDLEDYSEKVKKRLGQMKKVWHDERREKERALREREEAIRVAQTREDEIRQLRARINVNEKAFVAEAAKAAASDLTIAKDKVRSAYESGDAERIAEAQEALTQATLRSREVEKFKPALQKQESGVQPAQQERAPNPAPVQVDRKAEAWREKNTWFGADEEMTALALGLHEKLVRSGIDPRSDKYYELVDQTMRKRFPENFEEDAEQTTEKEEKPAPRTKAANVVAPVTRSSAPRQTIKLTSTQVAIAKKLGLSNEQYAKEVMKLEAN